MSKHAPHLPKKEITTEQKALQKRLSTFFIIICIALFAGTVSGIIIQSWLYLSSPVSDTRVINFENNKNIEAANVLDSIVAQQVSQRRVRIFDKRQKVDTNIYKKQGSIGEAVVLSAGGWVAMYKEDFVSGQERNWEVFDEQDNKHPIKKVLFDNDVNIVYLELDTTILRGDLDFQDISKEGSLLFSFQKERVSPIITAPATKSELAGTSAKNIIEQTYQYNVVGNAPVGSIIISERGSFIGFAKEDNTLVPSWVIRAQLSSLLSEEALGDYSILIEGYLVDVFNSNKPDGFYVTKSGYTNNTSSTLLVGDIITEINTLPVSTLDIQKVLFEKPSTLELQVLRDESLKNIIITL